MLIYDQYDIHLIEIVSNIRDIFIRDFYVIIVGCRRLVLGRDESTSIISVSATFLSCVIGWIKDQMTILVPEAGISFKDK